MTLREFREQLDLQLGMDDFPVRVIIDIDGIEFAANIAAVVHENGSPKPTTALKLLESVETHAEAVLKGGE
jgi:predicted ATPase